jgi:hypothetical protein
VLLDDLPGKFEAVCREMPLNELAGRGDDWFMAIARHFCDKYGCRRLQFNGAVDVEEIRQEIAYERGV